MMKLEDHKEKIDAYFENTPPSEIIKHFEELGYEFEPIDAEGEINNLPLTQVNQQDVDVEELSMFDSKEEFIEPSTAIADAVFATSFSSSIFLVQETISRKTTFGQNVLLNNFNIDAKFNFPFSKNAILSDDKSEDTQYTIAA